MPRFTGMMEDFTALGIARGCSAGLNLKAIEERITPLKLNAMYGCCV